MNPILAVLILSILGVLADYFLKVAGKNGLDIKYFIIGLVIYASTAFGWFYAMKHLKLSSVGVFYSLFTLLLLVGVGIFIFHEKLNIYEVFGIIAAVISMLLLSRFS